MNIYDWDEPGIGRSLTYMAITAITFFIILWIIEYRIISTVRRYICRSSSQTSSRTHVSNAIDCDVINEKNKVNAMSLEELQTNNLVLQNLSKFYGDFLAVKGISVAVKRYSYHHPKNKNFNFCYLFSIFFNFQWGMFWTSWHKWSR